MEWLQNIKIKLIAPGRYNSGNIQEDNVGVDRIQEFLLEKGYDVALEFLYTDRDYHDIMEKIGYANFYGITLHSENVDYVFDLAHKIKSAVTDATIFVGGIFATSAASNILSDCMDIDFVVLGHGEYPLLDFFQKYGNGFSMEYIMRESQHIYSRLNQNAIPCYSNVNKHLIPTRAYLERENKTIACIIGSHGCYGHCTFCTVPEPNTKVSFRDVDSIFNEISDLYENHNIRFFYFLDAAIEGWGERGKERLQSLCKRIQKSGFKVSFRAFFRADSFKNTLPDIQLLKLVKKVGFVNIIIGMEAGNENDLKVYRKVSSLKDNYETLEVMEKSGIHIILGFIILNPYTASRDIENNYMFLHNSKFALFHNYINCLQVSYGTDIYEQLKRDHLLDEKYSYKCDGYEYHCKDSITEEIFQFIKSRFIGSELSQQEFQFNNYLNHVYYMANIIEDSENIIASANVIRSRINKACRDYFYWLFVEHDFKKCEELYESFCNELIGLYHLMRKLNNATLKKYYKEYN